MKIRVISVTKALKASEENPSTFLEVRKKKVEKKFKLGTYYLDAKWTVGDIVSNGWFSFKNVEIPRGCPDPNDKNDRRNDIESGADKATISTRVSIAGDLGAFLLNIQKTWDRRIKTLEKEKMLSINARKINPVVITKRAVEDDPGREEPLEDPIIRIKLEFTPFPQAYPVKFLAGTPKTRIFDYREKIPRDESKPGDPRYKPAMVMNPQTKKMEPVTKSNLHLFITDGSTIREGRLLISNICVSQQWISMPIMANMLVIEPGTGGGFDNETDNETDNEVDTPAPQKPPAPAKVLQKDPDSVDEHGTDFQDSDSDEIDISELNT